MGPPVRVALLGGGTFARSAYLPLLTPGQTDRTLIGIWSRTRESAESAAGEAGGVPSWHGEEGLQEVLARPDVDAVIVVVAAQATLQIVRQALAAGKVVLSEKPAGPTVAAVKEVLDWMQASGIPAARWSVQENYRGESGLVMAAELARSGALGRLVKADLVAELPMNPGSRYYASAWRRQLPGSFLLEGGVHFVAALRLVCAAAGAGEPGRVSALLTRGSEGVPGPDTLVGWARFDGGVPAGVSITQAGAIPRLCVTLVGTQGTIEAKRGQWGAWTAAPANSYTLHAESSGDVPASVDQRVLPFDGVGTQVGAFVAHAAALRDGRDAELDASLSVQEAARDLALMEALLRSGERQGEAVDVERLA